MSFLNWRFLVKNKPLASVDSRSPRAGFCFRYLLLGVVVSMASARMAAADPNMYLNQAEIDAIKLKINAGEAPWTTAYSQVLASANAALTQPLESVTFQGPRNTLTGNNNDYFSTRKAPHSKSRGDYFAAIRLGDKVRDLGLAYAFTGEAKYADRVIELIDTWSLDPKTRMTASRPGNRIETYITMPGYFYGADLISNYDGWDPAKKSGFEDWVKTLGNFARDNREGGNNFSNWRVVTIASAGAFLHDQALLDLAETEWKRLISTQISPSNSVSAGVLGREVSRHNGLSYSLYSLNAMLQAAEILSKQGVNLYDYTYKPKGGGYANVKLALDYITPYALAPETWEPNTPYEQERPVNAGDIALYELAYSHYQDKAYLDVLNRWGRPINEKRVLGNITLTHGNTFELDISGPDGDNNLKGTSNNPPRLRRI